MLPVEGPELAIPLRRPVGASISLHGQLAPLAWAAARARPGVRLGFVQTAGGALPGGHSRVVRELRERGLLAGFLTAGPAYGGEGEAITTAGAVHHGLRDLGWDAAVCGPGPGILGSGSALGHGGLVALDSAHAALALGCAVVLCARMSSGDPRPRHQRPLAPRAHRARAAARAGHRGRARRARAATSRRAPGHEVLELDADADVDGYAASGLPARTMGRGLDEDRLFFAAALAAGQALAAKIARHER